MSQLLAVASQRSERRWLPRRRSAAEHRDRSGGSDRGRWAGRGRDPRVTRLRRRSHIALAGRRRDHRQGAGQGPPGVETIIEVSTGPTPDQQAATEFSRPPPATCRRPVSGPACGGSSSCRSRDRPVRGRLRRREVAQERAALAGPIPARTCARPSSTSSWSGSCVGDQAAWLRLADARAAVVGADSRRGAGRPRHRVRRRVDAAGPRRSPARARSVSSRRTPARRAPPRGPAVEGRATLLPDIKL